MPENHSAGGQFPVERRLADKFDKLPTVDATQPVSVHNALPSKFSRLPTLVWPGENG
jgi:hypothetical protein